MDKHVYKQCEFDWTADDGPDCGARFRFIGAGEPYMGAAQDDVVHSGIVVARHKDEGDERWHYYIQHDDKNGHSFWAYADELADISSVPS